LHWLVCKCEWQQNATPKAETKEASGLKCGLQFWLWLSRIENLRARLFRPIDSAHGSAASSSSKTEASPRLFAAEENHRKNGSSVEDKGEEASLRGRIKTGSSFCRVNGRGLRQSRCGNGFLLRE
jgi:hypothetical protein